MKITSSYAVQIKKIDFDIMATVDNYREAVSFCIDVCEKEWATISQIKGGRNRRACLEHFIHTTKDNKAKYEEFDKRFNKFPSYLRRDAMTTAIGIVSSYHSNYTNWEENGKQGNPPQLSMDHNVTPVFYRKNMYLESDNPYECQIKVFVNNDWVWKTIHLNPTDVKYIQKHKKDIDPCAPVLEKRFGLYFLRFAFVEKRDLYDTAIENRVICAVDLGLNNDAVCSIMTADGTVHARKFINFPCEKDQLYRVCNRIKKQQRKHGNKSVKSRWRYATHLNNELSGKIATAIVEFAELYNADTIVFEHLDMKQKKRGKNAQKLHLWRKNGIQEIVMRKAHLKYMHVSRICAWGTSKLAFDGSGEVTRDPKNHSLATFQSGKQYNCDLSASYNIGARYFIRKLLNLLPEKEKSQLLAKVPEVERRTSCTLDTLKKMNSFLKELSSVA